MKHAKLLLLISAAFSFTTCKSPDSLPDKVELRELNTNKQYHNERDDDKKRIEVVETPIHPMK